MATNKTKDIDHDVFEKMDTNQLEDADASELTPAEQKRIIRRVDRRLIITTGLMFCCCLMDRNNLGAAAIAGMSKDLKLIQYRYVSCISLQVPRGLTGGEPELRLQSHSQSLPLYSSSPTFWCSQSQMSFAGNSVLDSF